MKLVGILSWYDERPDWLVACITSMVVHANIDHLVAVDGAYSLYPGGKPRSRVIQHAAILGACEGAGIGVTLHIPDQVYPGNEIEKRTLCFQLAEQITEPDDWYLIMDADQIMVSAFGLRENLANTELDVATAQFHEQGYDPNSGWPVRNIFRAIRGLHVHEAHCNYRTPDGRYLWSNTSVGREPTQEQALWLEPNVRIEHKTMGRTREREQAKTDYYDRRARMGAEALKL